MKDSTRAKIGVGLTLATIVAGLNDNVRERVMNPFQGPIDNAIYGRDVSSTRYVLGTHEIKSGQETIPRIAGGNPMMIDYIKAVNNLQSSTNLPIGDTIIVPIESNGPSAKTLHELFKEFYSLSTNP